MFSKNCYPFPPPPSRGDGVPANFPSGVHLCLPPLPPPPCGVFRKCPIAQQSVPDITAPQGPPRRPRDEQPGHPRSAVSAPPSGTARESETHRNQGKRNLWHPKEHTLRHINSQTINNQLPSSDCGTTYIKETT